MKIYTEHLDKLIGDNEKIVNEIKSGNTKAINQLMKDVVAHKIDVDAKESKNYILNKLGIVVEEKEKKKEDIKQDITRFEIKSRMWKDNDGDLCMKNYYKVYGLLKDNYQDHNFYSLDELKQINADCTIKVVNIIESQYVKT